MNLLDAFAPWSSAVVVGGNFFNTLTPTSITDTQIVVSIPGSDITATGPLSIQIQTGGGDARIRTR